MLYLKIVAVLMRPLVLSLFDHYPRVDHLNPRGLAVYGETRSLLLPSE